MRKKVSVIFLFTMMLFLTSCSLFMNEDIIINDGNNDESIVFIKTAEDFKKIKSSVTEKVELINDIDMNNEALYLDIDFNGEFDGGNYSISNINNNFNDNYVDSYEYNAIFKNIGRSGVVKNLVIKNSKFSLNGTTNPLKITLYHGILAGVNNGTIENVQFSNINGFVTHEKLFYLNVGIITGVNNGKINNVTVDDQTKLTTDVYYTEDKKSNTGIIAGVNNGEITNSVLHSTQIRGNNLGGVTQENNGLIRNVANINQISYSSFPKLGSGNHAVGSISAENYGVIENVYSFRNKLEGEIGHFPNKRSFVGGLVGKNYANATLSRSYYHGSIKFEMKDVMDHESKTYIAGLAAHNQNNVYSSFSDVLIKAKGNGVYGSLITGDLSGNTYDVRHPFSIKYDAFQAKKLWTDKVIKYGEDKNSYLVSTKNIDFMTEYFKDEVSTEILKWTELLELKGFMSKDNSNYEIDLFFPILKEAYGYESTGLKYQKTELAKENPYAVV